MAVRIIRNIVGGARIRPSFLVFALARIVVQSICSPYKEVSAYFWLPYLLLTHIAQGGWRHSATIKSEELLSVMQDLTSRSFNALLEIFGLVTHTYRYVIFISRLRLWLLKVYQRWVLRCGVDSLVERCNLLLSSNDLPLTYCLILIIW